MEPTIQAYLVGLVSGPILCALVITICSILPKKRKRP